MPISRKRKRAKPKPQKLHKLPQPPQKHTSAQISKSHTHQSIEYYQGLIPSPEMMEKYKDIDPSLPNRLVTWTEEEGKHRRKMENKIVNHAFGINVLGTVCAFILVVLIAILCYFFMINGHPKYATVLACSVMVALASIFVLRRVPKANKN